jgi:hypothetical protein
MKRLKILPLRIRCRAVADMPLPAFKGTVLHGALGWALDAVSPDLRRLMYASEGGFTERATPNPFALIPPLHAGPGFQAGESFHFGLTLFGCAVDVAAPCVAALQAMAERGLGPGRVSFAIELIEQRHPDGLWRPLVSPAQAMWFASPQALDGSQLSRPALADALEVAFLTPTTLTENNQPCRRAPAFKTLFSRALGRALMVGSELHGVELLDSATKKDLLNRAGAIRLTADATCWQEVERFSPKEERERQFGGLLGLAAYEGDFTPFIPWLALAQALQVGKKTSFGFGVTHFRPTSFL